MFESEEFPGNFETDVCAFVDPRTSSNGVRILCAQESFQPEEGVEILTDLKQYNVSRLINGLCEGSSEIGNQFPLNMHLDALKGVSFSKGCYLGQELTQRTHFTGVIRKVALPFMLLSDQTQLQIDVETFNPTTNVDFGFDIDLKGQEIFDSKGKKLGKVIACQNNVGVALIDL